MKRFLEKLSIYDLNVYSTIEQIIRICKKTNEVVDTVNEFDENMIVVDFDCTTGDMILCRKKDVPVVNNASPTEIWESDF